MGVRVGSAGHPAWLWPLSDFGPAATLGGRQRFCTSEGIRPVRLLEIHFSAVAHRAMWGYGVDPPSDLNPQCVLPQRPAFSAGLSGRLAAARLPHRDVLSAACFSLASTRMRSSVRAASGVSAGGSGGRITVTQSCFGESAAIAPTIPLEGIIRP